MMMKMNRRVFCALAAGGLAGCAATQRAEMPSPATSCIPRMDLHVHLDNSTIDQVMELSVERGVKFGIVEHAGTKENVYPVVLSNDEELRGYLDMLSGKPVFKGVQAEWTDWMSGFSKEALRGLDYVLMDAMTFPGPDGRRMKLWEKPEGLGTAREFMDRYVDWHVELIATQPMDILANGTWLPGEFAADYDTLWTDARFGRIVDALVRHGVALEISSGFMLPRAALLRQAKAAGCKFTIGSNGRHPKMGLIDFSLNLAEEIGLTEKDFFIPGADGPSRLNRV